MERPVRVFDSRPGKTWLVVFACCLYFAFCWTIYTITVEPLYGASSPPSIEADSGSYFQLAGFQTGDPVDQGALVNYGGSSLGPVVLALIGRSQLGVACINCLLFLLVLYWGARIPGVSVEVFALLLALNPQTLPTLMTLNKEILAAAGMIGFAAYLYSGPTIGRRGTKSLLFFCILLSILARWQQALVLFWYLAAESRWSPVRRKPKWAILALLLVCSLAYAVAVNVLHINLAGFFSQTEGAGLVVLMNGIQARGGYFLVAAPKILMNLAGRLVTPSYFLQDYWLEDFHHSWQNQYIGVLASVVMLSALAFALLRNRLRLARPLIHLTMMYFICTAINPFVQPRYMYPGYAILALELARRKNSLESVPALPRIPLPPSYRDFSDHGGNPATS